jgi:hypothetical protein
MTYEQLVAESLEALQDVGEIKESEIKSLINDAYCEICEEVEIPSLKTLTTKPTVVGQAWLSMGTEFDGRLLFVGTSTEPVAMYTDLEQFLIENPLLDESGDVYRVCLEGSVLWYQGIPTVATSLVVLYYKTPTLLVNETDTPISLPTYLHRNLIVNKVGQIKSRVIEDGVEGEKLMTAKFAAQYEEAKYKLQVWIAKRTSHSAKSIWDV